MAQQSTDLTASLIGLAEPICAAHGLELVDVRYLREPGGAVVRVVIDRTATSPTASDNDRATQTRDDGRATGSPERAGLQDGVGSAPQPSDSLADASGSSVTLADCTAVSRDLSTTLDVHDDLLPGAYRLEVSSPGLDRPLVRPPDFQRFAGREIKVQTRQRIGNRRRFRGVLVGIEEGVVRIEQDGESIDIPHRDIARANLVVRL